MIITEFDIARLRNALELNCQSLSKEEAKQLDAILSCVETHRYGHWDNPSKELNTDKQTLVVMDDKFEPY